MDPEKVHDRAINLGEILGKFRISKKLFHWLFAYENRALEQEISGIKFKNPVGLAAGFDKDAHLTQILGDLGFGFSEIGSITGEPCEGNPQPRLWRLPKSKSIIVYYGLKNDGAEVISKRLSGMKFSLPVAVSIAKTNSVKCADVQGGISDYAKAYNCFLNIGDFFVINISCPNAFGGEPFTDPAKLDSLLEELNKNPTTKPTFLKLPPNLPLEEMDKIIKVSQKHHITGFIVSNLAKDKNLFKGDENELKKIYQGKGSFSGKPIEDLSNKLIEYIYRKTSAYRQTRQGKFIIIGCGGIFSAQDAYKKIRLGASLVQLITGMVFEGPQVITQINRGLAKLLEKDGYKNISEAIGADIK